MSRDDAIFGCLLGGAIGDALGGPYEGLPAMAAVELTSDGPLSFSDDTQLTLATCEAIVTAGRVEAEAIAAAMARWYGAGRVTGIGGATAKALSELCRGGHWARVGRKGEMAAGNGAAMRAAPLAFWLDPSEADDRRTLRDICGITHHNEEAYAGALAVVVALRAVIEGRWRKGEGLLAAVAEALPDTRVKERLVALAGQAPHLEMLEIAGRFGCSGYVVETVPLALAAVQKLGAEDFELMIERVIGCGGDTDTNASIAGQVAGALWGGAGLPETLLERVAERGEVEEIARRFAKITPCAA